MLDLVQRAVKMALDLGATDAECTASEGDEFSVSVRMREVEELKEAGSRAAGLRVLIGQRVGSSYTSDLSEEGIRAMVRAAVEIAGISGEDPFAGLPDGGELGGIEGDLGLYSGDVAGLETSYKIGRAAAAEEAALSADTRITNSDGGSFGSYRGGRYFANSRGFARGYRTTSCSLSAVAVATEGEAMERDYWSSSARAAGGLEAPELIGRTAAMRAVRRLGSRKVATQKAPVVFEARVARSLVGHLFEAVEGGAVYRKASFLAGRLGEVVAGENVTIVDDGTMPGLFGTSPFDDEGVPSRRTVVIERGVLKSYLLNSYTGRKLGMRTTGNASRGVTGNAGVGHGNLYLEAGVGSAADLIRGVKRGLYVTELIGSGVNEVTGDYSRGAVGLWIEGGELAYSVSEITIAGNLRDMLKDVAAVGGDLEFRGSVASPTVAIGEMTISGN